MQLNKDTELAIQAVQQVHRGEKGRLILGLTPSASYSNVSQSLYNFRVQYPDVVLDLKEMNSSEMPEALRSEEHTSELQSLMRISYAVFCLKKKNKKTYK